jgi:hypothetical protein
MPSSYLYFTILLGVIGSSPAALAQGEPQHQVPLLPPHPTMASADAVSISDAPPQHGRFLHLTDIHVSKGNEGRNRKKDHADGFLHTLDG